MTSATATVILALFCKLNIHGLCTASQLGAKGQVMVLNEQSSMVRE